MKPYRVTLMTSRGDRVSHWMAEAAADAISKARYWCGGEWPATRVERMGDDDRWQRVLPS